MFLNVFATWCPPCRAEQPDVVAFAAAHPDDTLVIGIDVAKRTIGPRVPQEVRHPVPDRDGPPRRGNARDLPRTDGAISFPMTVVIRPDGYLSCAWSGDRDRAWFEAEREAALGRIEVAIE